MYNNKPCAWQKAMDTNRKVVIVTLPPSVSEDAVRSIHYLVATFVARLEQGKKVRFGRVKDDLTAIAADDLQSNYNGVVQAYLTELRRRIDVAVRHDLHDGSDDSSAVASSQDATQNQGEQTGDQDSDPDVDLAVHTEEDLRAAIKAVRGAYNWLHWRRSVSQ